MNLQEAIEIQGEIIESLQNELQEELADGNTDNLDKIKLLSDALKNTVESLAQLQAVVLNLPPIALKQ